MKLTDFLQQFDQDRIRDAGRGEFLAPCPAHNDTNPSLLVGQTAEGAIILACRAGCQTKDVLDTLGLGFSDLFSPDKQPDANRPISSSVADPDGPNLSDIAALAMYALQCREHLEDDTEIANDARAYIHERWGVDAELAERLNIGVDPGGGWYSGGVKITPTSTQVPRVTIPFHDFDGRTVGLQARAIKEHSVRWCNPSNPTEDRAWSKMAVFDIGTGLETVLICEGPGDALTAAAAGHDSVAVRGAAVAKNQRLKSELIDKLGERRVVLCGDRDPSGDGFNKTLGEAFSAAGIATYVLDWSHAPPDVKDLTEWRESDSDRFVEYLHAAVDSSTVFQITTPTVPDKVKHTETALASMLRKRFLIRVDDRTIDGINHGEGIGFMVFNGSVWVQDVSDMKVRLECQAMGAQLEEEGEKEFEIANGDRALEAVAKSKIKAGDRAQRTAVINGILKELAPMVRVPSDAFDSHHDLLAVRNGVVDLRTGELQPHDPRLKLTKQIEFDYEPDAEAPRFLQFLDEVFDGVEGMPEFIQRMIGYGITGHTGEQCFTIAWGRGANGKSALTEIISHVFRPITQHTAFSTFEQKPSGGIPNDIAALRGARLVFASEGDQGRYMSESTIKRAVSQDELSARHMRAEWFSFQPTFLIWMSTNHKPQFKGQDPGLWRRVKLLPFERFFKPEERDHYLSQKLKAESTGILAWAVNGARQWYENGLQDPSVVIQATSSYKEMSDVLAGFFDNKLIADPDAKTSQVDIYECYKVTALDEEGMRERDLWSARALYQEIEERGYNRKKVKQNGKVVTAFIGVRLLKEDEIAAGVSDEIEGTPPPVGNFLGEPLS